MNRQLKRRTNVISIFPSEASLLRIVTAKAMDLSDEWEGISGKSYISPEKLHHAAEALQAASSQPQHPAASPKPQTNVAPMTGILQKKACAACENSENVEI
ncbi:MAG: transposase [Akkermansia sp.]